MVTAITGAALQAHRYPDPLAGALRAELAALHGVHPDQILVGNGSDELIFLLAWAYLAQQGHAVCAAPYRIDEISTHVVGARLTRVPLRDWPGRSPHWATRPRRPGPRLHPAGPRRKSRIMRRRVATHNTRANAPVTRFRVLADSEPSPSP